MFGTEFYHVTSKLSLETTSRHFYFTKPSPAAKLTGPTVKRL